MHAHHRYKQTKKVALWGAFKNVILGTLKVIVGILGNSHALLADGLHSFSDLLTDILVLTASRWGSLEADSNHPYGHQRIETAASMFLAFLLMFVGLAIGYDATMHLIQHSAPEKTNLYVPFVALISIAANEVLYQYTHYTGKKISSDLLIANAWHHRSDALSSIVVLIGIMGALIGYYWLDPVAACIVGIMIIHMGAKLTWTSICELVDTGVDVKTLTEISNVILDTPGVLAIHQLRTRSMGSAIFVDVHVLVYSRLSVSEGHYIAEQVYKNLQKNIHSVKDVTVHIDPEDDMKACSTLQLPSRHQLFQKLKKHSDFPWESHSSDIILHYLDGKIFIELYNMKHSLKKETIEQLLKEIPYLGGIT